MRLNKIIFDLIILIVLFDSISLGAQENIKDDRNVYVFASKGLNLRAQPDQNAEILRTIPYAKKLKIKEIDSKIISIDQKIGQWTHVSDEEMDGWVFGGYLLVTNPNELITKVYQEVKSINHKVYQSSSLKFSEKNITIKSTYGNYAIVTYPGTGLEPGMSSKIDSVWFYNGTSWNLYINDSKSGYEEKISDSYQNKNISLLLINDDLIPDFIISEYCCGSISNSQIFLSNLNLNLHQKFKSLSDLSFSKFTWTHLCGNNLYLFVSSKDDKTKQYRYDCKSNQLKINE